MRACLGAVMAVMVVTAVASATAQDAPPGDVAPTFGIPFDVPDVQAIALSSTARGGPYLYAAVTLPDAGARIVQWKLNPAIRLDRDWPVKMLVSDLAISPRGLVYAVGRRDLNTQAGGDPGGGQVTNINPVSPNAIFDKVQMYEPDGSDSKLSPRVVTIPRFNQAVFDGAGRVYLTASTSYSVALHSDDQTGVPDGTVMPQLILKCGPPAQFSVFRVGDHLAYVASTIDGALLETGGFDVKGPDPGEVWEPVPNAPTDCFRVANVFAYKEPPLTLNSVAHAVLFDRKGQADALLALEPNTGTLHLLRLDPKSPQLSRVTWYDLKEIAPPGKWSLLAASEDGSVIFVGGLGLNEVVRFRRDGDSLVKTGTHPLGEGGLRQIKVSADGALAALVMRIGDGKDRMHLIWSPVALSETQEPTLRPKGERVILLQQALNASGCDVSVDGTLGPQTKAAGERFVAGECAGSNNPEDNDTESGGFMVSNPNPIIEGVFFPPRLLNSTD